MARSRDGRTVVSSDLEQLLAGSAGARLRARDVPAWPDAGDLQLTWSELEVVSRRVNRPWVKIERLLLSQNLSAPIHLELESGAVCRLDGPFSPAEPSLVRGWRATGRIARQSGRLARSTSVEIEIVAWSEDAAQLRLRPVKRTLRSWGARRQRRYFALAHECADQFVYLLLAPLRRADQPREPEAGSEGWVAHQGIGDHSAHPGRCQNVQRLTAT